MVDLLLGGAGETVVPAGPLGHRGGRGVLRAARGPARGGRGGPGHAGCRRPAGGHAPLGARRGWRCWAAAPRWSSSRSRPRWERTWGTARSSCPHAALAQGPRAPTPERWRAHVKAHLGRLSSVRAELRCVIGRADLTVADIRALGSGDVVLLDEATARPDLGQGGTARLEVGPVELRGWRPRSGLDGGTWKAIIRAFHPGRAGTRRCPTHRGGCGRGAGPGRTRAPEAGRRAGREVKSLNPEGGDGMDAMSGEGADLLGDVPLQLTVELARLPMTAEAVVGLRVGQVLDLRARLGRSRWSCPSTGRSSPGASWWRSRASSASASSRWWADAPWPPRRSRQASRLPPAHNVAGPRGGPGPN